VLFVAAVLYVVDKRVGLLELMGGGKLERKEIKLNYFPPIKCKKKKK
jgi:hypothetical protein